MAAQSHKKYFIASVAGSLVFIIAEFLIKPHPSFHKAFFWLTEYAFILNLISLYLFKKVLQKEKGKSSIHLIATGIRFIGYLLPAILFLIFIKSAEQRIFFVVVLFLHYIFFATLETWSISSSLKRN